MKRTTLAILTINGVTKMVRCPLNSRGQAYITMDDIKKLWGYRDGQVFSSNNFHLGYKV